MVLAEALLGAEPHVAQWYIWDQFVMGEQK